MDSAAMPAQRLTNARSCRIGDVTGASEAKTPTEPSKRQFAEGRGQLCARCLLCLLAVCATRFSSLRGAASVMLILKLSPIVYLYSLLKFFVN